MEKIKNGVFKKEKKTIQLFLQPKRNKVNLLSFPEPVLAEIEQKAAPAFGVLNSEKISSTDKRFELKNDEEASKFLTWVTNEYLKEPTRRAFFHKENVYMGIRSALRKNGILVNEAPSQTQGEQNPEKTQTAQSDQAPAQNFPLPQPAQMMSPNQLMYMNMGGFYPPVQMQDIQSMNFVRTKTTDAGDLASGKMPVAPYGYSYGASGLYDPYYGASYYPGGYWNPQFSGNVYGGRIGKAGFTRKGPSSSGWAQSSQRNKDPRRQPPKGQGNEAKKTTRRNDFGFLF